MSERRQKRAADKSGTPARGTQGKLRIGDQWNAIRIIALSQSNPLKAIAEFVENSIDARAQHISIVRGKHAGEQYLKVVDDGEGIRDIRYVATHIGDSIKRKLKEQGQAGIQGEFGIGLLSFWTVGEELALTSKAQDGEAARLHLVKESPAYSIKPTRELFERPGTTLHIKPLLSGVRMLSGEKIQSYLASELRDRIRQSGVAIRVIDRSARKELLVEPRRYTGQLLHELPAARSPFGEIYTELYLTAPGSGAGVTLQKAGTRVLSDVTETDAFRRPPWTTGYVEGIIDAPFIQLTPGTRGGVIYDDGFDSLVAALAPLEEELTKLIEERRRAEEEEASRAMLKRITRALREAFSMLPAEEYGWLAANAQASRSQKSAGAPGDGQSAGGAGDAAGHDGADGAASAEGDRSGAADADAVAGIALPDEQGSGPDAERQRAFFDFPGPLYRLDIRPASAKVQVGGTRKLHAVPRDKSKRTLDADVGISWWIESGSGSLEATEGEFSAYLAPPEPELATVVARARQGETECEARAHLTVTADLGGAAAGGALSKRGLPGYTYRYAPGELWRSRYDQEQSLITVNTGHHDFIHASRASATKLRYVAHLFAKEIVLANFPGARSEELLERMVELELYMEQHLR